MVVKIPKFFLVLAVFLLLLCICVTNTGDFAKQVVHLNPEHVLIIDPGHGGDDGGAVIEGSNIKESEINLLISQKLEKLCHLYGINTVMTRDSDNINYPAGDNSIALRKKADQNARLELIWDYPGAMLYSIHQNYYPSASPFGPQVLYGHDVESNELGILLQNNLLTSISPQSRRVAAEINQNIYLLKHCRCTSVLIECGFLSNPREAMLLQDEVYQRKIASVLAATYLQFMARKSE